MWRIYSSLLRRSSGPAPARTGILDARRDRLPDGWEPWGPGPNTGIAYHLDRALIRATGAAARGLTRRDFLKRGSQLGALLALTIGGVLTGSVAMADHSTECNVDDPHGELPGACGPSELCPNEHCNNSGGCNLSKPFVRRRFYTGSQCAPDDAHNCWIEDCCDKPANGHVRCCDCCSPTPTGSGTCACSSPTRYKCLCRENRGGC